MLKDSNKSIAFTTHTMSTPQTWVLGKFRRSRDLIISWGDSRQGVYGGSYLWYIKKYFYEGVKPRREAHIKFGDALYLNINKYIVIGGHIRFRFLNRILISHNYGKGHREWKAENYRDWKANEDWNAANCPGA